MKKLITLFAPLMILGLLLVGCQGEAPVSSNVNMGLAAQLSIPSGATLESATFSVFGYDNHAQTVNVHRINADWDEMTVTYNNFGGAYEADIIGSFVADGVSWYSIDVTSTVAGWLAGDFDNFGFYLEQGDAEYSRFFSSEFDNVEMRPKLEMCYALGGETFCVTVQRDVMGTVEDAYINMLYADMNFGALNSFFTGMIDGQQKMAMVKFDMEDIVVEPASLGDYVWYDVNQDGIQDDGEIGVADVTVRLFDCEDNLMRTTVTDENGYYLFDELMPGDYYVVFSAPDGFYLSPADMGADDAIDSDADMNGKTICTNLEPGEHDMTWDAGIYSIPMEGCTLTIGYWKTHAGFGPQSDVVSQYLPIWLGDADGDKSIEVTDNQIAHDILTQKVYGKPNNGITKLYAQMLAAKLNMAAGADFSVIADYFSDADEFLADHDYTDWKGLSKNDKKDVLMLKSTFDDYNNGDIGPGHCGDFYDGDDD